MAGSFALRDRHGAGRATQATVAQCSTDGTRVDYHPNGLNDGFRKKIRTGVSMCDRLPIHPREHAAVFKRLRRARLVRGPVAFGANVVVKKERRAIGVGRAAIVTLCLTPCSQRQAP